MEANTSGLNRTGAAVNAEGTDEMLEAAESITPQGVIDTSAADGVRMQYITDAKAIGSIPLPPTLTGIVKAGISKISGGHPSILMDKIGERMAFERGGTRLYDALLVKYKSLLASGDDMPSAEEALSMQDGDLLLATVSGETPLRTLERIRAEEQQHFQLLVAAMEELGGDPTAQTPCADVVSVASMGLIQVVTDPRTTMAQCLNAILTAELTDNAGWELLSQLTEEAGEAGLTGKFLDALSQEQGHLLVVKAWLASLVSRKVQTESV